ncbi:MAG: dihydrodipicolinate synthase family protein [Fimbriimonadaceae bacterium]
MRWHGVFPAITTPFHRDGQIDFEFLGRHSQWLIDSGCQGLVLFGSLGEGGTLSLEEKRDAIATVQAAIGDRAPIVVTVGGLSTAQGAAVARLAAESGCHGLMILPPYAYRTEGSETLAHFRALMAETALSCMLYNNPIAYGTDVTPDQIESLLSVPNFHSVKESSADVRRITEIRRRVGDRLALFVGVDDLIVEGIDAGATGWIAGLVNAFPVESVRLFEHALAGRRREARELYEWFLPLLRLDVVPKFVQLIKLTQAHVAMGSESVRPPRLPVSGAEREAALAVIRQGLATRPAV